MGSECALVILIIRSNHREDACQQGKVWSGLEESVWFYVQVCAQNNNTPPSLPSSFGNSRDFPVSLRGLARLLRRCWLAWLVGREESLGGKIFRGFGRAGVDGVYGVGLSLQVGLFNIH